MLLRALKSNQPLHFLLIPVIAIALWVKPLMNPQAYPFYAGEDSMILYRPFNYLLADNLLLNNILALFFTVLLSFLILKLNIQHTFIRVKSFLPSILFILITSGIAELHTMHPIYPAALFLVLTIDRMFNTYDRESIHSNAFDAGVLLSIGSLFYLNLVFFFPLLWFGFIIIKQKVNWREYILSTIGFALPWLAAFGWYMINGFENELRQTLQANFTFHQLFIKGNLSIYIYAGLLGLLTLFGSFFILSQYDDKRISSRKFFKVFFWMFVISVILVAAHPAVSKEMVVVTAIPLCYLISNQFIFMKKEFWGEMILFLLLTVVVYLQFV